MSLGLFNCRLIQLAGDQLFFFQKCINRRACERHESRAPDPLLLPFAFFSVGFVGSSGRCQGRAIFSRRSEPLTPPRASIECQQKAKGTRPCKPSVSAFTHRFCYTAQLSRHRLWIERHRDDPLLCFADFWFRVVEAAGPVILDRGNVPVEQHATNNHYKGDPEVEATQGMQSEGKHGRDGHRNTEDLPIHLP